MLGTVIGDHALFNFWCRAHVVDGLCVFADVLLCHPTVTAPSMSAVHSDVARCFSSLVCAPNQPALSATIVLPLHVGDSTLVSALCDKLLDPVNLGACADTECAWCASLGGHTTTAAPDASIGFAPARSSHRRLFFSRLLRSTALGSRGFSVAEVEAIVREALLRTATRLPVHSSGARARDAAPVASSCSGCSSARAPRKPLGVVSLCDMATAVSVTTNREAVTPMVATVSRGRSNGSDLAGGGPATLLGPWPPSFQGGALRATRILDAAIVLPMLRPERLTQLGLPPSRGFLLYVAAWVGTDKCTIECECCWVS